MKPLSFIIIYISSFLCFSQQIITINFDGLKKTKPAYLKQFLTISEGQELDSVRLYETKQQLANLEMFSDVRFEVLENQNNYEVIFYFIELHTLLPIFSFGGIKENFWIQIGASEANLGGIGNKLITYYQYYDKSSFATHLTFDRIRETDWGINLAFVKWSTLEPLYFGDQTIDYEYDNYTFGVNAIKHFNFTNRIEYGGAFFTEDYPISTTQLFEGIPEQRNSKKILGKIIFIWNHIDHHFFYLTGWHNQFNIETVKSLDGDPTFYIAFNEVKKFWRKGKKQNFATRLRLGLSSNGENPFAPFVLDSYLNIRGVGNRVDRGTGSIIFNAEYRYTLVDKQKTAFQGIIFSDSGIWRNPNGDFGDFFEKENSVLFAGGGVRFIHKKIYNAILRVDYGFNLKEPSINGFVLGVGQYF